MSPRLYRSSWLLIPFLLSSLACNYLLSPFTPPTPTPTIPALAILPRQDTALRPPTATATPTPTPTNTPTPTPTETPTALPTPTIDTARLSDPNRPELSGEAALYGTEHFLVHYTFSGRDAVPAEDSNGNGIPDYVEAVGEALEFSWQVEIVQLGWAAPPSDGNLGGDARYDVYLEDIYDDGTAGYTDGGYRHTRVGDNPNTPAIETRAHHSYLSLDNDYREDYLFSPLDMMRVTAAHELNHAIQFGYDGDEPAEWLWEATATWMEDLVYDHINDGVYYLDSVFKSPDICQIAEGKEGEENEYHWYGMWIFLRYISENYGNEVIRTVWENLVTLDGYPALETALERVGTNLDEVFRGFAVALLIRGFEEGAEYPTIQLKGEIETGNTFNPANGVEQMAMDYITILGEAHTVITLQGLEGLVVGLRGVEAEIFPLVNEPVTLDASQYDYVYAVVLNLSRASRESECRDTRYSILTGPGEQVSSPAEIMAAPNFRPPRVKLLP